MPPAAGATGAVPSGAGPSSPWPPTGPGASRRPPSKPWSDFGVTHFGDRRAFVAALAAGLAFDVAAHNGFVTVAGTLMVLVGAIALLRCGPVRGRGATLAVIGILAVSILLTFRSSPWVIGPVIVALGVLFLLGASYADHRVRATFPGLAGRLAVASGHVALAPGMVRVEGDPAESADTDPLGLGSEGGDIRRRNAIAVGRGLVLAIPVIVVIGALLAAADPLFKAWFDLPVLARNALLITTGAWLVLGLIRASAASKPELDLPPPPKLGTTEALCILGAVCTLYGLFVVTQLVGLAGGSERILRSEGLTYAEYARSGFFQLLWAAGLTIVVLLSVRACTDRASRAILVASEALVVLTLGIVVSALYRLHLYESAYGLTLLRLACTVTAVWIGTVFVITGIAMARQPDSSAWLAPTVVGTAIAFVLAWGMVNPAAIVAETNLRRAAHGDELDVTATAELGSDAVPAIVSGTPRLDPGTADELRRQVCAQPARSADGMAFNASVHRADNLLWGYCLDVVPDYPS